MEHPLIGLARQVFWIEEVTFTERPEAGILLRGRLLVDGERAFNWLLPQAEAYGYTPFLSEEGGRHVLFFREGVVVPRPSRIWINVVLFLVTLASTLFAGALQEGVNLLEDPSRWTAGAPFAFTLMAILGTHELGHYFAARRHRAAVTLPYFIPMPISFLGTMGAFIQLRSAIRDRKVLFDIGVAGPLAGMVVALPLLIVGLALSPVVRIDGPVLQEGNSLLYLALKFLIHGRVLPQGGYDVLLHPIAFAAWFGLLVTCFNLLPIGQLDGGHIAYALFGRRAWQIAWVALAALVGMTVLWEGWGIWAFLGFLLGPRHPPPLNDVTELDPLRRWVGYLTILLFILVFTPIPLKFVG